MRWLTGAAMAPTLMVAGPLRPELELHVQGQNVVSRQFTASMLFRIGLGSSLCSPSPSNGMSFSVCVCPCPTAPEASLCPQHRAGAPLGQSEELQPLSQRHPFLPHLGLASRPNGDWSQPCLTCDRAARGGTAVCFSPS